MILKPVAKIIRKNMTRLNYLTFSDGPWRWPASCFLLPASCSCRETAKVVLFYDLDNSTSTDMSTFCLALAGINRYCNCVVNIRANTQTNIHTRARMHTHALTLWRRQLYTGRVTTSTAESPLRHYHYENNYFAYLFSVMYTLLFSLRSHKIIRLY